MTDAILNPDQYYSCGHSRAEMATASDGRWGIAPSYFIESYPGGISRAVWDRIVDEAFAHFQENCGIGYSKASSAESANIVWGMVRTARAGSDGPMGTLAFMYLPQGSNFRGQIHGYWDGQEPWQDGAIGDGIDAVAVTRHELGHGLGMLHTNVPNQLLNPYYDKRIRTLQDHDKQVLVGKYGPAKASPSPPTPTPTPVPTPTGSIPCKILLNGVVYAGSLEAQSGASKVEFRE